MTKLEQLKEAIAMEEKHAAELRTRYNRQKDRVNELKAAAITEEFGIKIGSIVVGRQGEFLVTSLQPGEYGSAYHWLRGRKKTKDGWSKLEQSISNWKLKQ